MVRPTPHGVGLGRRPREALGGDNRPKYTRQDSNLQPSVPKFEAGLFRKSLRNHEIGRYSLPANDFREHIRFCQLCQLPRKEGRKSYRFEDSSNPDWRPKTHANRPYSTPMP
jgi:hypothetical protein